MVKVLVCSTRLVEKGMGPPLRGLVHSAFAAAANLVFPDGFLISLNASNNPPNRPTLQEKYHQNDRIRTKNLESFLSPLNDHQNRSGLLMPNGLLLGAGAGEFPFAELRAGMPVVLGAGWLVLDAVACALDFTDCPRWSPRIQRPAELDAELVRANGRWLTQLCQSEDLSGMPELAGIADEAILGLAERLCGRGPGLTPGGDDFLAGWMAAGWLLTGPQPDFLATCQQVCQLARQRTHVLSQCWLEYAAAGDVALPVSTLLEALTIPDRGRLEHAARVLLALGATSGFDLLQGILYALRQTQIPYCRL